MSRIVSVIYRVCGEKQSFKQEADLFGSIAFEEDGMHHVEELHAHVEKGLSVHTTCLHYGSASEVTNKLMLLQLIHQNFTTFVEVLQSAGDHFTAVVGHEVSTTGNFDTESLD